MTEPETRLRSDPAAPEPEPRPRRVGGKYRGRILVLVLVILSALVYVNASQSSRDARTAFVEQYYLYDENVEAALQVRRGDEIMYAILEYASLLVLAGILLITGIRWMVSRRARKSMVDEPRRGSPIHSREGDDLPQRSEESTPRSTAHYP